MGVVDSTVVFRCSVPWLIAFHFYRKIVQILDFQENKMETNVYKIAEIEGKGVGFVASKDIEKGTVILREKPQFSVKGGRAEWMERYWLKSMMDSYKEMDKTE